MLSTEIDLAFEGKVIRIFDQDGDPWFVLADVCRPLGLRQPASVARRLDDDEKGVLLTHTLGGPQQVTIISEAGLYKIVGRSDAAVTAGTEAHRFLRWLTHEVLPSIRKFGAYPPPPLADLIENDRFDGRESTVADRFREERLLWEERHGKVFADAAPVFTRRIVDAIERGEGRIKTVDRLSVLIHAEIDVLYILTGRRAFSSQERRIIYRTRQHLLG